MRPKTTLYEVTTTKVSSGTKFFGFSRQLTKDNHVVYRLKQIADNLVWGIDVSFTREDMRHRIYVAETLRAARRQLRKEIAKHGHPGKKHEHTGA